MSLPKGYTPLEYITATGTQYIDTGFKPNQNSRIVVTMELDSSMTSSRAYFGTRDASKVNGFAILTGTDNKYQFAYNNLQPTGLGSVTFAKNVFEIDRNAFKVNGSTLSTQTAGTFSCTYTAYILSVNHSGAAHSLGGIAAKLYSCQVYDNGTLVRDYFPCMTNAREVGLWDDVNSVFYGNAGAGVFEAGTVILTPPEAPTNFRVESEGDGKVTLAWDAAKRAEAYRIFRGEAVLADTDATTATVGAELFATINFSIIAYNEAGESEPVYLTYQKVPENSVLYLVTDRTMQDVSAGTAKGYYSAMDLNRVGATVEYLAKRLSAAGVSVSVSPVTDWEDNKWPAPTVMEAYLEDVRTMRSALALVESTPEAPADMEKFTYAEANGIESILVELDEHLTLMLSVVNAGWATGTTHTGFYFKEAY